MTGKESDEDNRVRSFNLVKEPWIPVLTRDGTGETVSLEGIFEKAPQISQIVAELPTVGVAIEGLLQAVLRRAVPVYLSTDKFEVASAVNEYWADWEPVREHVREYLAEWEHRFDLLDPEVPFFQVADLRTAKGEAAGLEMLLADVPNGTPFLTMRRGENLDRIGLAEAARWIVHAQAYDPSGIRGAAVGDRRAQSGRVYPIGPGWTARFGVITPRTGCLNEDLLLSTVPTGVGKLEFDPYMDLPAWERDPGTERPEGIDDETWEALSSKDLREIRRQPRGPADVLTWQSRRIRLIVEENSVIGLVLAAGDPLDPPNRYTVEPRAAWRFSKPQTTRYKTTVYMPRELPTSSSLWRGIESLFPRSVSMQHPNKKTEVPSFYGPAISSWLAELTDPDLLGDHRLRNVTFEAVGMVLGSNMAVVDDITTDSLSLPVALLREESMRYREAVHDWIDRAEKVATAIAGFAADLARAAGAEDTDGLFESSRGAFLANAHSQFLAVVASLKVGEWSATLELGERWSETLRILTLQQRAVLLLEMGDAAIVGHESGGRYLTAGSAERQLQRRLARILGFPDRATENAQSGNEVKEGANA